MTWIQHQVEGIAIEFVPHCKRKYLPPYFATLFVMALACISCTTLTVSEYEVPALDEYAHIEQDGSVAVAVFPMHDQVEQIKYFGSGLSDHGVLPISVLVRNNSSSSYLLSGNQIQISSTDIQTDRTEIASDDTATVVDVAGVALISPALIVIGGKMHSNASVVRHSLEKNELRRTIVSPGGAKHGFIYAPLEKGQRTMSITIPLQDMDTSLETPYRFRVELNQ